MKKQNIIIIIVFGSPRIKPFPKMRTATCRSCQSFPKIPW